MMDSKKKKRKLKEHLNRYGLTLSGEKQLFLATYHHRYPTPEVFALELFNPFPLITPIDVNDTEAVLKHLDRYVVNRIFYLSDKALLELWRARRNLYHLGARRKGK